jgi:hypothetical protein
VLRYFAFSSPRVSFFYDVIPAGSVTRYCGSLTFTFSLSSKASQKVDASDAFCLLLVFFCFTSRLLRPRIDPSPKQNNIDAHAALIFSGFSSPQHLPHIIKNPKMFFVVFRVCKATKFAFFDRERRAKTLNLNEWMRDEGSFREGMQSPGCCIITKEANNDYNRFQGGILKERTERRAGAQFSVFFSPSPLPLIIEFYLRCIFRCVQKQASDGQ